MMNKFKMELTWHNCETCPPDELYNNRLIMTNGRYTFDVAYHQEIGWQRVADRVLIPQQQLKDYYWADIDQTVRGCPEFKGE